MSIRVQALTAGFYLTRRRPGDQFDVAGEKDFSPRWMMEVAEAGQMIESGDVDPRSMKKAELRKALEDMGVELPDDVKKDDLVEMYKAAGVDHAKDD